jgi:hypothetical protein
MHSKIRDRGIGGRRRIPLAGHPKTQSSQWKHQLILLQMTPTILSRFSRENVKQGKTANNDIQTGNRPRRNGIMRTSSDNHKAINDYADSFYGSFLGNEKTKDAATQIIESLKYSEEVLKEIYEISASLKDGNR